MKLVDMLAPFGRVVGLLKRLLGPTKRRRELMVTFTSKGEVSHAPVSLRAPEIIEHSRDGLSDLAKQQFKPVGLCIYCGATDQLTREHIIPFALNGAAVLPAASCRHCSKITGRFEEEVLRGPMRSVRVLREMWSRSKHSDAPRTHSLRIMRNGVEEVVELSLEEYPILLHFPVFSIPRYLRGTDGSGIEMKGVASISFGPDPKAVGKKLGAQEIVLDGGLDHPVAFARMIGKIAYGIAIAQGELSPHQRPEIVSSILGERDDIGKWVGTVDGPFRKYETGTLHRTALARNLSTGMLMVEVQLFADSVTPTYEVVFG